MASSSKIISPSAGFFLLIVLVTNRFLFAASDIGIGAADRITDQLDEILDAKALLISLGVPERNLCRTEPVTNRGVGANNNDDIWVLPLCEPPLLDVDRKGNSAGDYEVNMQSRILALKKKKKPKPNKPTFKEEPFFYIATGLGALCCITSAALAAGLSMGMLSLDPLMLLVKIRASTDPQTKSQAESLLPVVNNRHRLLVTLLLLNSLANEALPLFLEKIVSPLVSVLLSVTFVLIFGEILPTAIFTGPKKLELASKMVPMVNFFILILAPIAYPIAKLLDKYLHEDEEEEGAFGRGEISALIRIQYEERLATKRQRKAELMDSIKFKPSTKFPRPSLRSPDLDAAIKHTKKNSIDWTHAKNNSLDFSISDIKGHARSKSIHSDEVMMVEGALQMKTKTAISVFTPLNRMFAIPDNLILNEENVVDIYSSGYSRIPVYERNPDKPKSQTAIKGILNAKHLIVVNMNEDRALSTMPLATPPCVSPTKNLVELVNLFQTGRHGHFALVCARPDIGSRALREGGSIPASACLMGIVTLEDVLEELLQEEIYDENDPMEKEAERIAVWVGKNWRRKSKQKAGVTSMADVVVQATENLASESTSLL